MNGDWGVYAWRLVDVTVIVVIVTLLCRKAGPLRRQPARRSQHEDR